MKVTTKNISETKVEITVTLDKNDLQTAKEQAVARLAKEVNVQGFRKGKVPAEIAEKHINPNDLASTTADIAVRRTVPMAFSEAKKAPSLSLYQMKPSNTKLKPIFFQTSSLATSRN